MFVVILGERYYRRVMHHGIRLHGNLGGLGVVKRRVSGCAKRCRFRSRFEGF